MKYLRRKILFLLTALVFSNVIISRSVLALNSDFIIYKNSVQCTPLNVIDDYNPTEEGLGFLKNRIDVSPLDMIANYDGTYTLCIDPENEEYIYIYEYDKDKNCYKNFKIEKVLPKYGSMVKDFNNNYYIFFGLDIKAKYDKITKNMALVKYNSEGEKIAECFFNEPSNNGTGVKKPLLYDSEMKICGNDLLIYFGCEMYAGKDNVNHKGSYAAMFDISNFTNITKNTGIENLFAQNSYDRSILSEPDGFVIVDRVASYPRSFKISKFSNRILKSTDTFTFKGDTKNDNTYSELGGIAKTPEGYLICGTYENNAEDIFKIHSAPRNIFVQKISNDLSIKQEPIFITNYLDKSIENAVNLKFIQVESNKNIILWEVKGENGSYNGTYMATINDDGLIQGNIKRLNDCRLNMYDDVAYNPINNKICWAINGQGNKVLIYELDLNERDLSNNLLSEIKLNKYSMTLQVGASEILYATIDNEETSNKNVTYKSSNESIATVDDEGRVKGLNVGKANILVTIEDGNKITTSNCEVEVTMSNVNFEKRVIELCNIERKNRGIEPLIEDEQLMNIARIKSQNMIDENYFGHVSPTYGDSFNMMLNFGVKFIFAAENIAEGRISPEEVVDLWMKSDIHRANIINKKFTNVGVGTAVDKNGIIIWTQEFVKPRP